MATDAQRRATARSVRANVRQVAIKLGPPDRDILEWLDSQPNKAGYIKRLIREDMERSRRGWSLPE